MCSVKSRLFEAIPDNKLAMTCQCCTFSHNNTPFSLSTRESRFNIAFGSTKCSSTSPRTQSALQLSRISDFVLNLAISPITRHMFLAIAAASLSNSTPIYFAVGFILLYSSKASCAASNLQNIFAVTGILSSSSGWPGYSIFNICHCMV